MNIKFFKNFCIIIFLSICQTSLAQDLTNQLKKAIEDDPSLFTEFDLEDDFEETVNKQIVTENQELASSEGQSLVDLSTIEDKKTLNRKSILTRYFHALTGEDLNNYGAEEFNLTQDNKLLFFNTIGKDYQLAPGDIIQITITGLDASNDKYQVMNDGTITLENAYPLNVANLDLNQVSELVHNNILINDASAEVYVRLITARLITIQISGNVNSPRTIAIPAYTPLSRTLAYSGGVSSNGSLRNIVLSQVGSPTETIDFYNFLQNPSQVNDPLIKNGARIFVSNKGSTIAATGFVNNPGIYELPSGKSSVTIEEFMKITGTSFFPSGATLKVLYFDSKGKIATRLASKYDLIYEGEAFKVDFVETRDLNISKVYGAVLKNYALKTNTPLSIKEVLKNGAVLSPNAHYQFALIDGKEVKAINLDDALENDSIILPTGSDLRIFTKKEYLSLVSANPNKSSNPLISKLVKATNLAEIYLDGMRIAYVPVNPNQTIYESIINSYTPGPKTIFDIALLENDTGVEAFDLKSEISERNSRTLDNGDRLFIFEDKFYDDLLMSSFSNSPIMVTDNNTPASDNVEAIILQQQIENEKNEYLEALSYSQRILQKANLINIKLDGERFTYLPFTDGMTSSHTMKKLQNRLPKLVSEFVVVQNINQGKTPEIKNLNDIFEINQGEEINFISSKGYRLVINNFENMIETNLLSELKSSNAVKVYYDGKLVLLLPPNYMPSELKLFEQYTKKSDLYKLYVGLNTTSLDNGTWNLLTFGAEEFFSDKNNFILGPSNVVNLFSNDFIMNEFINDKENINGVNFNVDSKSISNNKPKDNAENTLNINNTLNAVSPNNSSLDDTIIKENSFENQGRLLNSHLRIMRNSLRTISGSVQFPGSYPVAKKIRLSSFLSTAGLIEHTAKSDIIITQAINQADRLTRVEPKKIKLNNSNLKEIVLSGLYYLDVPLAINDAITGVIEVKGEVLIPGNYSFTRSETLQDIIRRAGGLSDVAYPLGAVLQRESARELEKETNNILADQLEDSILNLAQSSLDGVGEQVQVVLGYASQLRNQPTVGRMALNILNDSPSNPIFLENGDKLTIPKRPSHVSVVGSVQRSTIASYVEGQDFSDYLQAAGGVTKVADTRKAYLLLPNGESRQLNKSSVIPVGSVIIVPPKLDRLSILGGTDIISKVLSNISNSILSIQNVD